MKSGIERLNEVLLKRSLRCYHSDSNGEKKITVIGIEGIGYDFNLSLTWHNEIIISDFKGTVRISDFCEILAELEKEIKTLNL
jgi:hypothetical protein